jgi:hypothetical protein
MGAIFISYRRDDADGHAGRLFQNLREVFGAESVFMDVVGIEPGVDFRKTIDAKLTACSVLLAMMGRQWLVIQKPGGPRRLDDDNDFVRLETAAALRRDIHVIPVLVQGARMPTADELPDDLKDLAYRNGVELTHARWDSDVQLLVQALARHVQPLSPAAKAGAQQDAAAGYRAKVAQYLADGVIMPLERKSLDELRDKLGLTPDAASAIEAGVLDGHAQAYQRRLQQYRQDLATTIAQGYPLSEATRADLLQRRAELALKPDDAECIDRELLDAAEATRLERHLAQLEQQRQDDARRQAEAAARKAKQQAEAPPPERAPPKPVAAPVGAVPVPAPALSPAISRPAGLAQAAPAVASGAFSAAAATPSVFERMKFAGIGAAVSAICAALPYLVVAGASEPDAFIGGAGIIGAVAGAISTNHRWVFGLGALWFLVNLLS